VSVVLPYMTAHQLIYRVAEVKSVDQSPSADGDYRGAVAATAPTPAANRPGVTTPRGAAVWRRLGTCRSLT
jgi:hypothetical protein